MGIVSLGLKYAPKAYNYAKRAVKVSPDIIFGKGAETFVHNASQAGKAAIKANGSWGTAFKEAIKGGGKAVESSVAAAKAVKGGFLKQAWTSLKGLPSVLATSTKAGARAARIAGKSPILGSMKGFFKGIGKKMPLLGNLMLVAFELPNIFKATKEQGIMQGGAEVVKAGARLGGASIGAAVGTAVAGPIGGLAGWIAGEWLTSKVVGKSYTEQKEEAEQKQAEIEQQAISLLQQNGINPYGQYDSAMVQNPYGANPYAMNPIGYTPETFGTQNPFGTPSDYDGDIMMRKLNFNA